jgi:predicted nucleic acid-binding protein
MRARNGRRDGRETGSNDANSIAPEPPRVIIDACVWHSAFVRHVLRHSALEGLFEPRWTAKIESEWIRSVQKARPQIPLERLLQVRDRFRAEFPAGLLPIRLPRRVLPPLPDPNDSHVIEAALECKAYAICTLDDWGFPDGVMRRLGIETLSRDELLLKLIDRAPARCRMALHSHRMALESPSMSRSEYLAAMSRAGLRRSAIALGVANSTNDAAK